MLCLANGDNYQLVKDCRTMDEAIGRLVRRQFGRLVRIMVRHGVWNVRRAVLILLSETTYPMWYRVFRGAAQRYGCYVVAGSIMAPANHLGPDTDQYEPAGAQVYNLSLTFDPAGRVVNQTHKVNLVPTLVTYVFKTITRKEKGGKGKEKRKERKERKEKKGGGGRGTVKIVASSKMATAVKETTNKRHPRL